MAVQQNKKSPSKRNMRRAHDALTQPTISTSNTGAVHLRHHIDVNGMHHSKSGSRKVIKSKDE